MADANFQLNQAGLRSVFKSEGMQSALRSAAEDLAAEANGRAAAVASTPQAKYYNAYARVLKGTAVAGVSTATQQAERHEAKHHTLSSVNH